MKKIMLSFAAVAAFVSVASAEDAAWFTGTIGSEAGGKWTMNPGSGTISTNSTTLVLDEADSASFAAGSQKSLSSNENLNFATSAKFACSYDELPAVDSSAKAGVVVFDNKYYVLEKDAVGETNKWVSTGIDADLENNVAVAVTITNGTDGAHALYKFGTESAIDKLVVASGEWGTVDYKGSGEVASLVGTTISLGGSDYPIPGDKTIAKDVAEAWATANGIAKADLGAVLLSGTEFNGRTAAESCLLGVATNAALKATVVDEDAAELGFVLDCTPVSGRALIKVKKDGAVIESGVEVQDNEVSLAIGDGIYQVFAEVDGANKQIPVSQLIGVKGTEVAAETVYFIGAPYAECAIADLFKKTCCKQGDKVEVYDATTDSYKSWMLKASGEWEFATGQGDEPVLIRKGQAVKYTTAAATKLYQVGEVTEANITPIVKGKWNLVASPKGSIAATALPLDTAAAQAIQLSASGTAVAKTYLKSGDNVMYRNGYKGSWNIASDEDKVTNAFFVKPTNAESINW